MTVGKWLAAATGVVALFVLCVMVLGVAASIPAWLFPVFVIALATAIVIG